MAKISCIMEEGKIYGGVKFLKEIPNPGKSKRRYCEVECVHCGSTVGRILSHVYSGIIQSCGCQFKKSGHKPSIKIGDQHVTNQGYKIEVVEYVSSRNISVRFIDSDLIIKTNYIGITRGGVENPYHKSVCGVAYVGELSNKAPHYDKIKMRWHDMLTRVYSSGKEQLASYSDCKVCDDWHNFTLFYYWVMQETQGDINGLALDKDILSTEGKIYSPETCAFIPKTLNVKLTNLESRTGGWFDSYGNRWRTLEKCPETGKDVYVKHADEVAANKHYVLSKANKILKLAEEFKSEINERFYMGMVNKAEILLSLYESEESL